MRCLTVPPPKEKSAGLTTRRENGFWLRRADLAREICSRIVASRALNRSGMVNAAPGRRGVIVAINGTKLTCAHLWVLGGVLIYGISVAK